MESDGEAEEYGKESEMMSESSQFQGNIHDVDVMSEEFAALPSHIQHEVLLELKDTRKQSSWGRLHQMPKVFHTCLIAVMLLVKLFSSCTAGIPIQI